jgi:hypothetical protein
MVLSRAVLAVRERFIGDLCGVGREADGSEQVGGLGGHRLEGGDLAVEERTVETELER